MRSIYLSYLTVINLVFLKYIQIVIYDLIL
jgi:hypothetical protein